MDLSFQRIANSLEFPVPLDIRLVGDELHLACKVDESRQQQQGAVTKIRCQVGQFPADSSSLQAEQEVTETLWSDSDLIKCYQTHISACTQSPVVLIMTV